MSGSINYTIIGDGDHTTLCVVDFLTGNSTNIPDWGSKHSETQEEIMEILNNPEDVDDAIAEINQVIFGSHSDRFIQIRKDLGVEINGDGTITIGDITLPHRFQDLLSTANSHQEAEAVVAFAKDLNDNPGEHCKEALIEWLLANPSLSFDPQGRIIGYRSVLSNFDSQHSGYGIVNGVEYADSQLSNIPGNVLEFPRFMTDSDPSVYCSVGLHVGTWKYARNYISSGPKISVAFKASDVVSPPHDAYQEKIRVSKFEVLEEVQSPYEQILVSQWNPKARFRGKD